MKKYFYKMLNYFFKKVNIKAPIMKIINIPPIDIFITLDPENNDVTESNIDVIKLEKLDFGDDGIIFVGFN